MIDKRIRHVIVFKNGNVAVCDADGQQIAEYQGSVRRDPDLIGRLRAACGPGVEWMGTEHLTRLSSPLVDWMPPPPPGYSTQDQRDIWRKLICAPHWEAPEMEAANAAISNLLAEVEQLHDELRVAKFERDEVSKRRIVAAVGHGATVLEHKQLLDGLAQYLPPQTPRTIAGVVDAVRQLREAADGIAMKDARTNAAFQKLLELSSAVVAKLGAGNDVVATKLDPGHDAIVRCKRCYLRYETSAVGSDFPCPYCSDAHVGIGRSFDEACADAMLRLRLLGKKTHAWAVFSHHVYSRDVGDKNGSDDRIVHMIHLRSEHGDAG